MLPDASDPAVGILDPLYDEVLNCDLSPEGASFARTPGGRTSDMSLEHSFDQTHLMRGNSASDTRPLFPLTESQATVPEESLLLGSAPGRAPLERRSPWQQPLYAAYGSAGMYDSMFRAEHGDPRTHPPGRASLANFHQQPHPLGGADLLPERRVLTSFDSSHCTQPSLTHSQPQQHFLGPPRNHALGDARGATPQLQQLGPLFSSQSAPVCPLPHCAD